MNPILITNPQTDPRLKQNMRRVQAPTLDGAKQIAVGLYQSRGYEWPEEWYYFERCGHVEICLPVEKGGNHA